METRTASISCLSQEGGSFLFQYYNSGAYNGGFEFKDAVKQANEYVYDPNGNLSKDLNKNITSIQYNCLNLPSKVTFGDGSAITYTYSADGTKLRAVYVINGSTTTTDYCGNVVYENGAQKWLLTDEGYVSLSDNQYHYYLKDHQGNNRVVINSAGTVEETNHYYPFGGTFASSASVQPYKYNGKEYDGKKGLNWYDYGARWYDAAMGRFTAVDPMAKKYYNASPYSYCLNNPVKYVDPDGRKIVIGTFWQRLGEWLGIKSDFIAKVSKQFAENNAASAEIRAIYKELEESDLVFYVLPLSEADNPSLGDQVIPDQAIALGKSQGATMYYDPDAQERVDGKKRNPRIALAHEMGHFKDLMEGKAIPYSKKEKETGKYERSKVEQNERTSLELENIIREILDYELRESYFE